MRLPRPLKSVCILLLLLNAAALSACGQKGPLYIPQEQPDTEQTGQKKPRTDR